MKNRAHFLITGHELYLDYTLVQVKNKSHISLTSKGGKKSDSM